MSEKLMFKVGKGVLLPADEYTVSKLRTRNYRVNDLVAVDIKKPRSPGFNRLLHKLGLIVAANIEEFSGMDGHSCIKRLQIEANAGCYEVMANIRGVGMCLHRIPKSLSFETMDQVEYEEVARKICYHISEVYWPTSTPEQIERMALQYVEAA